VEVVKKEMSENVIFTLKASHVFFLYIVDPLLCLSIYKALLTA